MSEDRDDLILEPLEPPKDVMSNSALLMKKLAEDAPLDGMDVDGDKLVNKAKIFLVAQACNELNRVIKLTNFLDTLEEKFIDAVTEKIEESPHNLQLLTYAMETITESLNRSNQLITQILKDEKLSSVIINTTNIITPDGSSATVMSMDSRDTVRNWASSMLAQLRNVEDNPVNSVAESTEPEIIDANVVEDSEKGPVTNEPKT